MVPMKFLIIGASGVLGSRLYNDAIKKKWNVLGTYCSHECGGLYYLDVRDRKSIEKIFRFFEPEAVVLAGGVTDVDFSESRPKIAEDVNIKGTLNIVKKVKEYGSKFMYVSTDYVFDGENGPYSEEDKPNPINKYGETKLEAENIVKAMLKNYLIVRTSQLFGIGVTPRRWQKATYAVGVVYAIRSNKKIYAADDFYSTPTYSGLLSEMTIKLIEKGASGIYHGAGHEFLSRYDYVNKIANVFGLDKSLIGRVKLKDLKLKAKRPKRGGLRIDKVCETLKIAPKNCEYYLKLLKREIFL